MAVLLHKWEFKNTEVEFLKVSEKNWSPGLPDIGAWKSWDFLILTVSARSVMTWTWCTCFKEIFDKGDKFLDFLFAFLYWKAVSSKKKEFEGEQILSI